jgi:hypothetical protein
LKLDKSVRDFLKANKKKTPMLLVALLVAFLLLLGGLGVGEKDGDDRGLEERVAEMCALTEGVGECRAMITYTPEGEVYAVLLLCDGGDYPLVREKLTSMMCALFGVGANRVEILKIKE